MIKKSCLNFYFILFITHNLVSAAEIEYYWSGATTEKSAVVSFATDSDAKITIQYSDNKNFRTNTLYSRTQVVGSRSNHFSKIIHPFLQQVLKVSTEDFIKQEIYVQ